MIDTSLTRNHFQQHKQDYSVWGTKIVTDKYLNDSRVRDDDPKFSIYVMWQPLTGFASSVEYGNRITEMYYAVLYDDPGVEYGDIVEFYGSEYEVVGLKRFPSYVRVEVERKKKA